MSTTFTPEVTQVTQVTATIKRHLNSAFAFMQAAKLADREGRTVEAQIDRKCADDLHEVVDAMVRERDAA